MAEFYSSRAIKATRKRHICESCGTAIEIGHPAQYAACKQDGEFFAWYNHPECLAAEKAWNDEADYRGDEYCWLWQVRDDEYSEQWIAWLIEHHPIAAALLRLEKSND